MMSAWSSIQSAIALDALVSAAFILPSGTTQPEELLADQPTEIQDEIIRINTDAGNLALQMAMIVPALACLLGFVNSFRMMRLPDHKPSAAVEGLLAG